MTEMRSPRSLDFLPPESNQVFIVSSIEQLPAEKRERQDEGDVADVSGVHGWDGPVGAGDGGGGVAGTGRGTVPKFRVLPL